MRVSFTKMQGAGNDFVVLDATRAPLALDTAAMQRLGDRRFGVGADQILVVECSAEPGIDFGYRIFNGGSGEEVEQCGNGARCFVRYVHHKGLSTKRTLAVRTVSSKLELRMQDDGRVTVDMDRPIFDWPKVPFDPAGLQTREVNGFPLWQLRLGDDETIEVAVVSMGNPHAVLVVPDIDAAAVGRVGPLVQQLASFPREVNVGFMQVVSRSHIRLRVYERGAGETLACGTGACAAVVAGIRQGLLDPHVDVDARGGRLTIEWSPSSAEYGDRSPEGRPPGLGRPGAQVAGSDQPVLMTGPAEVVFEGEIEL